jgi:hypothetical protein
MEIDLARMFEVVFGARCMTLAPVSFQTSPEATPTFRWSARASTAEASGRVNSAHGWHFEEAKEASTPELALSQRRRRQQLVGGL